MGCAHSLEWSPWPGEWGILIWFSHVLLCLKGNKVSPLAPYGIIPREVVGEKEERRHWKDSMTDVSDRN